MSHQADRVWIVWERQRRSIELARRLGCEFHEYDIQGPLRYPISIARTVRLLAARRPRLLFVQNPSMILATIACLYGVLTGNAVIVDRHTTFLLNRPVKFSVKRAVFLALHRFTLRHATLTIVTNTFLSDLVDAAGGRGFVLPDPIPELVRHGSPQLEKGPNILVVSSFADDEPIAEVLEAARVTDLPDVHFYVSGRYARRGIDWAALAPKNVTLTGFLSERDYVDLLFAVDGVMALTKWDHCMLCGCYEAVAAAKPLITSDKPELRDHFRGAIFARADAASIGAAVRELVADRATFATRAALMRPELEAEWCLRMLALESRLLENAGSKESSQDSTRRS
jgi:glycosyltransferase involved in cell wall biosynthesis